MMWCVFATTDKADSCISFTFPCQVELLLKQFKMVDREQETELKKERIVRPGKFTSITFMHRPS